MVLDLRFIPDEMEFTRQPRDSATELPPKYAAPAFSCSALQQSNVKLSWDADDAERAKVRARYRLGRAGYTVSDPTTPRGASSATRQSRPMPFPRFLSPPFPARACWRVTEER
eukprot:scaffold8059_cov82-Isochrysis_galbana.AAC.3